MQLSNEELVCMRLFFNITGVEPLHCLITDDGIAFLVDKDRVGMAIGRNGSNIKRLREKMNKNVYVFAKVDQPEEFIKRSLNVSSPILNEVERNNKKVIFVKLNTSDKYSMRRGAVISLAKELFKEVFGKEMRIQSR